MPVTCTARYAARMATATSPRFAVPTGRLVRAFMAIAVLTGCPETSGARNSSSKPQPKSCTKAYEQCELGPGLLGVCDIVDCADADAAPGSCLRCRSQH
jgi:hypothetical protein